MNSAGAAGSDPPAQEPRTGGTAAPCNGHASATATAGGGGSARRGIPQGERARPPAGAETPAKAGGGKSAREGGARETVIENIALLDGAYACLHNAEAFHRTAERLFEQEDYQSSIPLSTISIEEAMKGMELVTKFRRGEDVSGEDWRNLTNHRHKLTHILDENADIAQSATKQDVDKLRKDMAWARFDFSTIDPARRSKALKSMSETYSSFKMLRESCFYAGWNSREQRWVRFSLDAPEAQKSLTFFVLWEARSSLAFFKFQIEHEINKMREDGFYPKGLPFPPYPEHRLPKDYSAVLPQHFMSKHDEVLYQKGHCVMKEFIKTRDFERAMDSVLNSTLDRYFKAIVKHADDDWHPHPMIKAILEATWRLEGLGAGGDGKSACVVSDDADQTHDGKPMTVVCVVARAIDGKFRLEKVTDMSDPPVDLTSDMIEKVLRTEEVIERCPGKDVSADAWVMAMSAIGVKTKVIGREEIGAAIAKSKQMLAEGKIGVPAPYADAIRSIKGANGWESMDAKTRGVVAVMYGGTTYPGYNSYITPSGAIGKHQLRRTILHTVGLSLLPTA